MWEALRCIHANQSCWISKLASFHTDPTCMFWHTHAQKKRRPNHAKRETPLKINYLGRQNLVFDEQGKNKMGGREKAAKRDNPSTWARLAGQEDVPGLATESRPVHLRGRQKPAVAVHRGKREKSLKSDPKGSKHVCVCCLMFHFPPISEHEIM